MSISSNELLKIVIGALEDKKALDIVTLNLHQISLVTDYFVICHGNSERQVQALADEVVEQAEKAGCAVHGIEGLDSSRWVLIDLGDVVVHVFHRDDREYYNLERLWSDAEVVESV
ncbi:ribosomal silencing factor RsfS [Insulibacter thermoxylanivorax]|uniref:Ribosomal silencing factor RsfS n=1 Tax=Insulibacter thermoxylanivorax TaxID=2749268 RepID=A0A916QFB7_9BACL|nr:ribosome silencing factor [Insulibacter thermoxylanivorax]GFR37362.1 ribosomal silencing factor RsfS [Insulibacter thermoxylanivorax]